jgi:hypothetical protein
MSIAEFIPYPHVSGPLIDSKPQQKFEDPLSCVLECAQNSIDAKLNETSKVLLSIQFKLLNKSDLGFFDKNFESHLKVAGENGRVKDWMSIYDAKIPCLIMEDFFTTGIVGDPTLAKRQTEEGNPNNYHTFNFSFGGNAKLADHTKGGSEGEGRQTFCLASDISTFFYLSVDKQHENRACFFGMCYLGEREVQGKDYEIFSYFGEKKQNPKYKGEYFDAIPITDKNQLETIIKIFNLKRKLNDAGTSVIIPFFNKEEVNTDKILECFADRYRVPITRNQLEVQLNGKTLNKDNIALTAQEIADGEEKKQLCKNYFEFLERCNKSQNSQKDFYEIKFFDQNKIGKEDIGNFEKASKDFDAGKLLKLRLKFPVEKKDTEQQRRYKSYYTYTDIFLKKYPAEFTIQESYNDFIRGTIPIYRERKKTMSMFYLIDVQDEHASLLIKHAERANHSEISPHNFKLRNAYKGHSKLVSLIKKIPQNLYMIFTSDNSEADHEITQDLFRIEDTGASGTQTKVGRDRIQEIVEKKDKISDIIVPPIFEGLKKYETSSSSELNGRCTYTISGVNYNRNEIKKKIEDVEKYIADTKKIDLEKFSADEIIKMQNKVGTFNRRLSEYKEFLDIKCNFYPRRIEIDAAYDGEGIGNPFKRYNRSDFDFSDVNNFKFKLNGDVILKSKRENHISLAATSGDFKFSVTGFSKDSLEDVRWRDRNYVE